MFRPLVDAILPQTVIRINRAAHALDGVEQVFSIVISAKVEKYGMGQLPQVFWDSDGTKPHGFQGHHEHTVILPGS